MHSLSASRLNDFLGCPHQAALWLAGIKPEGEVDATLQLIRDKGFEHEAAVLARSNKLHGPAERIPSRRQPFRSRPSDARSDRARCKADLSRRFVQGGVARLPGLPVANRLGIEAVTLEPEDAKLSRKAKGEYLLQLGIYAELLETLFGIPVQNGAIHVAAGDPESFDLRRTRYILRRLMRSFERFVADEARVPQSLGRARRVEQCDYKPRCEEEWREADSPFFVAELEAGLISTRTKAALASAKARGKAAWGKQGSNPLTGGPGGWEGGASCPRSRACRPIWSP